MQRIFDVGCTPREYIERAIEPARPGVCPKCKIGKPHRHGFYHRYCFDGEGWLLIPIRRYRCPRCRLTISFLPSFCIPGFEYSLKVVWRAIHWRLAKRCSLRKCLAKLLAEFPKLSWLPQRISFYANRFLGNLPWMEAVLRSVFPRIKLGLAKEKRAKKVLATVRLGFKQIQSPARLYHEQCGRSFLAPLR